MKSNRVSSAGVACALAFFVLVLITGMSAQEKTSSRRGAPQDWTQGHIVFTRDGLAKNPDLIDREPRIFREAMQRWQTSNPGTFIPSEARAAQPQNIQPQITRDWTLTNLGGRLRTGMFPAKFTFDPTATPSCANDYIVFGLAVPGTTGSGGEANLVAFNNLYVDSSGDGGGLCPGTAPTPLFAYNITTLPGGKILTSPIMSLDGTKIAFMETVPGGPGTGHAIFHVVTWTAGDGTGVGGPIAPGSMTSIQLFTPVALTSITDSASSPWLDYATGTVYVGADNGYVYQITGALTGTPVLSGSPWPAQTGLNYRLTAPVLDFSRGLLMVGSSNGNLYQITTSNASVASATVGASGQTSSGIIAPPIVDVTNGTTFAIDANDGTSAVLKEFDTASLAFLPPVARIGLGSAGGTGTKVFLYQPTFSNDYYNDPSTGFILTCGTGAADTTPWVYGFGFDDGRTINTLPTFSHQLATGGRCEGWTEFFNPNIGPINGTDFFFSGLTTDCTSWGSGLTVGCVLSATIPSGVFSATAVAVTGGPSGIVVDNYDTTGSSIYFNSLSSNVAYKYTDDLQ